MGLLPFLLPRNKAYAARHGYDYRYLNRLTADLPVYWMKPHLVAQLLEQGYDAVAWLDTDAVVHDLDRRLEPFLKGGEAMVAAADNPYWPSPFNAGVFFVQGAAGLDLMRAWSALFAKTAWRREATAWVCDEEWAGSAFEQGAFVEHLLDETLTAGPVRLLDWRPLQAPFPIPESFTLHFAGEFKRNLPAYLDLISD
jgi:hypothetical protein